MKKILIVFCTILFISLCGCNSVKYDYSEISFSLNTDDDGIVLGDIQNSILLIKTKAEFDNYLLGDQFADSFSSEFQTENEKYDEDFFDNHDLIAIIYHATSGSIEEVKISSVRLDDSEVVVTLKKYPTGDIGTGDMGPYFSFYLTIENLEDTITSASYSVK
ncbi:MAG: hypothetical protein M0P99_08200 [Candidatus Cloacimonetes bacterium]|nr:hypothetical protein [Candidatus Cloacimonadota bacterium]